MTKPNHTPGPWKLGKHTRLSDYGPGAYTLWPHGAIVKEGLTRADARLIEAAPSLLAALEDALTFMEVYCHCTKSAVRETAIHRATAAIAAAKGGAK